MEKNVGGGGKKPVDRQVVDGRERTKTPQTWIVVLYWKRQRFVPLVKCTGRINKRGRRTLSFQTLLCSPLYYIAATNDNVQVIRFVLVDGLYHPHHTTKLQIQLFDGESILGYSLSVPWCMGMNSRAPKSLIYLIFF